MSRSTVTVKSLALSVLCLAGGVPAAQGASYGLLVPRHPRPASQPKPLPAPSPAPAAPSLAMVYKPWPSPLACTRLALGFQASEALEGDSADLSAARRAATAVMAHWRYAADKATIPAADIPRLRRDPLARERALDGTALLGVALGRDVAGIYASADELRHLPFVLEGSHVVLMLGRRSGLDPAKIERVAEAAKQRRIALSLVWVGETPLDQDARDMILLTSLTGGVVWDLKADETCQ